MKYFVCEMIGETGKVNQIKWIPAESSAFTIYAEGKSLFFNQDASQFHLRLKSEDLNAADQIKFMVLFQKRIEFFLNSNLAFFYIQGEFSQCLFEHNSKEKSNE